MLALNKLLAQQKPGNTTLGLRIRFTGLGLLGSFLLGVEAFRVKLNALVSSTVRRHLIP